MKPSVLTVLAERVSQWVGFDPVVVAHVLESIAIVLALAIAHMILARLINRHVDDVGRRYRWRRVGSYAFSALTILLVGRVWVDGLRELGVVLGLASAGIAIALREPLVSVAGWIFIMVRRPFHVGDRIAVGPHMGDVIDIRIFQTVIMECGQWIEGDQATGRILLIPNNVMFNTPVANYTAGFAYIWDEIAVRLTFDSDWRLAKRLVTAIAEQQAAPLLRDAEAQMRQAASEHFIVFHKLTPIVYVSVREFGIQLTLRYLSPVRGRRGTHQSLWEAILTAFEREPTITFSQQALRLVPHGAEAAPAAAAAPLGRLGGAPEKGGGGAGSALSAAAADPSRITTTHSA